MSKFLLKTIVASLIIIAGIQPVVTTANGPVRKLFRATMDLPGAYIGAFSGTIAGFTGSLVLVDKITRFNSKERTINLPENKPATFLTAVTLGTGTGFVIGATAGVACGMAADHTWTAAKRTFYSVKNSTFSPATQHMIRQRSMPIIAGTGICLLANRIYKENSTSSSRD